MERSKMMSNENQSSDLNIYILLVLAKQNSKCPQNLCHPPVIFILIRSNTNIILKISQPEKHIDK